MDRYEEAVMYYITGPGQRFVSPQFSIPYKNGEGGSLPDFVVIDFEDKTIYVVEVTTAWDTGKLLERVQQRKPRWINPLREYFQKLNKEFSEWKYRVTLFVREARKEYYETKLADHNDVSVFSIEEVSFPYSWEWDGDNNPINPLR